jgi:FkbM family methyltransferase
MTLITYAQNFEDVMLWRALSDIQNGFYIDIGAQDPRIDSISRSFYEAGWRGVHVEPAPSFAEALRRDRPDEQVVEAAIGEGGGRRRFFEFPETGLSTGVEDIAASHSKTAGLKARSLEVNCISLDDLLSSVGDRAIHWLKIDIEGMEGEALRSWNKNPARPWIVVVESTFPGTQVATQNQWLDQLLDRNYTEVYFDGLSRYFIFADQGDRAKFFEAPPNVFDGFIVPEHHFTAQWLNNKLHSSLAEAQWRLNESIAERDAAVAKEAQSKELVIAAEETKMSLENRLLAGVEALEHRNAEIGRLQSSFQTEIAALISEQQEAQRRGSIANAQHRADMLGLEQKHQISLDGIRKERDNWHERSAKTEITLAEQLVLLEEANEALEVERAGNSSKIEELRTHHKQELLEERAARDLAVNEAKSEAREWFERFERGMLEQLALREEANEALEVERAGNSSKIEELRTHHKQELLEERAARDLAVNEAKSEAREWFERFERGMLEQLALREELAASQKTALEERLSLTLKSEALALELEALKGQLEEAITETSNLHSTLVVVRDENADTQQKLLAHYNSEVARLRYEKEEACSALEIRLYTTEQKLLKAADALGSSRPRWWGRYPLGTEKPALLSEILHKFIAEQASDTFRALKDLEGQIPQDLPVDNPPVSSNQEVLPNMNNHNNSLPALSLEDVTSWEEVLSLHDLSFVRGAYMLLLGRAPDPEGENYYVARVRAGFSKLHLLRQLRYSEEGRAQGLDAPGLDRELRRFRFAQMPLVGRVWRKRYSIEGNAADDRRFRMLLNEIVAVRQEQNNLSRSTSVEVKLQAVEEQLNGVSNQVEVKLQAVQEQLKGMSNQLASLSAVLSVKLSRSGEVAAPAVSSSDPPLIHIEEKEAPAGGGQRALASESGLPNLAQSILRRINEKIG